MSIISPLITSPFVTLASFLFHVPVILRCTLFKCLKKKGSDLDRQLGSLEQ